MADVTRHFKWAKDQLCAMKTYTHIWACHGKLTVISLVVMVLPRAAVAERAGEVALHVVARGQLGIVRGVRLASQRVVFT